MYEKQTVVEKLSNNILRNKENTNNWFRPPKLLVEFTYYKNTMHVHCSKI